MSKVSPVRSADLSSQYVLYAVNMGREELTDHVNVQ